MKLIDNLQPQDPALKEAFRDVYVPEQPVSFDEALLYARRRQRARRRTLLANASLLLLLSSLYLYWSSQPTPSTIPLLKPVPPSEIAKQPSTKNVGAPSQPTTQETPRSAPSKAPTSSPTTTSSAPSSQKSPRSKPASQPSSLERPQP